MQGGPMMKNRYLKNGNQGFTLLEVMIAISIFGLLLLYASQFMGTEISGYDNVSKQNEIEQRERVAMMQILDELRLNCFTYLKAASNDQGVYQYVNATAAASGSKIDSDTCLIFIQSPSSSETPPPSTKIFFEYNSAKAAGKLWYMKDEHNKYLIADEISQINLTQDDHDEHLVKIDITIGGQNGTQSYELMTWVRLN
jgi:prepilin-type N-terminal cleavage/methylation domain-containing protein